MNKDETPNPELIRAASEVATAYHNLEVAKNKLEQLALAEYAKTGAKTIVRKASSQQPVVQITETKKFPAYDWAIGISPHDWFAANYQGSAYFDFKEFVNLAADHPQASKILAELKARFPRLVRFAAKDYEKVAKTNSSAPLQPTRALAVKYSAKTIAEEF